eukprot:NODE_278_length_11936_cov_0.473644.p7 type:complete len:127 gc:universal NODE_278_length_11936_cov_0.473644:8462-8082(-)
MRFSGKSVASFASYSGMCDGRSVEFNGGIFSTDSTLLVNLTDLVTDLETFCLFSLSKLITSTNSELGSEFLNLLKTCASEVKLSSLVGTKAVPMLEHCLKSLLNLKWYSEFPMKILSFKVQLTTSS